MDKFGIFKLLNSFFNYCEQNKNQTTSTDNGKNVLSSLLSSFNSQNNTAQNNLSQSPANTPTSTKETNAKTDLPPLQTSMIGIMNTHDEFVKRVKAKNSTPK